MNEDSLKDKQTEGRKVLMTERQKLKRSTDRKSEREEDEVQRTFNELRQRDNKQKDEKTKMRENHQIQETHGRVPLLSKISFSDLYVSVKILQTTTLKHSFSPNKSLDHLGCFGHFFAYFLLWLSGFVCHIRLYLFLLRLDSPFICKICLGQVKP